MYPTKKEKKRGYNSSVILLLNFLKENLNTISYDKIICIITTSSTLLGYKKQSNNIA